LFINEQKVEQCQSQASGRWVEYNQESIKEAVYNVELNVHHDREGKDKKWAKR
jgi:hypothetical protein